MAAAAQRSSLMLLAMLLVCLALSHQAAALNAVGLLFDATPQTNSAVIGRMDPPPDDKAIVATDCPLTWSGG